MSEEQVKPNVAEAPTQDAQLAAENMVSGKEKAPTVDFDADYAAAQEFSVSEVDRTDEGAALAEEATAPQFKMPEPEETKMTAEPTGNPEDYMEMAKDVGGHGNAVTEVSDDLVKKALDMGKPQT